MTDSLDSEIYSLNVESNRDITFGTSINNLLKLNHSIDILDKRKI